MANAGVNQAPNWKTTKRLSDRDGGKGYWRVKVKSVPPRTRRAFEAAQLRQKIAGIGMDLLIHQRNPPEDRNRFTGKVARHRPAGHRKRELD